MPPTPPVPPAPAWVMAVLASAAVGLPTLIAFNLPPSSTFFNQAASLIGWGAWLTLLAATSTTERLPRSAGLNALLASLALLLLAALTSPLWTHLPWSLSLSSAGTIVAAALVAVVGASVQQAGFGKPAFRAFCIGLVFAGVACSGIGIVQVFAPQWTDGNWIAHTSFAGRAVGNLRQPNHLSSLLLWSTIAVVWLGEVRVFNRAASAVLALLFIFVVVLSASRTGAVGAVLLALWGLLDRRLSPAMRRLLWLAPVAYALFWLGTAAWADASHHVFGGETRFSGKGDISSSRFGIWTNTLTMIASHPWLGTGFGEFNLAWTLTPFPGRPVAFFDHTHNLLLQFAVELGLPLAAAVLALMAWALYHAVANAWRAGREPEADPAQTSLLRAALAMVSMILVHSLLEYPLWYAYFLLPTAFVFGLCVAGPGPAPKVRSVTSGVSPRPAGTRPLLLAAMLLLCAGFGSIYDYMRVAVIFAPPEGAAPLAQRVADGRRSWFFAHHADYAAATTFSRLDEVLPALVGAPHYLLDTRLMMAWAKALNDAGDTDRARYVARRLEEFHNDQSAAFFEPCDEPAEPGTELPFQCLEPTRALRYEDFR